MAACSAGLPHGTTLTTYRVPGVWTQVFRLASWSNPSSKLGNLLPHQNQPAAVWLFLRLLFREVGDGDHYVGVTALDRVSRAAGAGHDSLHNRPAVHARLGH